MASHLYPNSKGYRPQFRSHSFKPVSYTERRPADRADIQTFAVRGKCTSSLAAPSSPTYGTQSGQEHRGAKKNLKDLKTSAELYREAENFRLQASKREAEWNERAQEPKVQLANAISSKGKNAQEVLRRWDKSSDGTVSKAEFRNGVSAAPPFGLGLNLDIREIDAIFDEEDVNSTETLELKELHDAIMRMKKEAKEDSRRMASMQESVDQLRDRAESAIAIAKMTEAVEKAEAALDAKCTLLPAGVQMGTYIMRKHMRVVDVLIKWDENSDGQLNINEFRHHVRELGVKATDEQIDELFNNYDEDNRGELNLQELKTMLRTLHEAAKTSSADIDKDEKMLQALRKKVKKEQVALSLEIASELRQEMEKEAENRRLEEEYQECMVKHARDKAAGKSATVADIGRRKGRRASVSTPTPTQSPAYMRSAAVVQDGTDLLTAACSLVNTVEALADVPVELDAPEVASLAAGVRAAALGNPL